MMLESRAPIYPSESKSVLRFSQKQKDTQLNKTLIAESLVAITASAFLLGPHSSPPMETEAGRSLHFGVGSFFCVVLLPRQLKWVNLRREVILKRLQFLLGQCLTLRTFKLVGISFVGNVKGSLDVMAQVVEGQRLPNFHS
jgi:hypothetical protein